MTNKTTKKMVKNNSRAVGLAVLGASVAGLAAAYFFLGAKGKQNQKHAKAWAIKMKGDVIEKLEMAKEVSEPVYREIIDLVAKEYVKSKKASREEIDAIVQDLRKHWKVIKSEVKNIKSDTIKDAKKVARKIK